jgi:hypothetical protein
MMVSTSIIPLARMAIVIAATVVVSGTSQTA